MELTIYKVAKYDDNSLENIEMIIKSINKDIISNEKHKVKSVFKEINLLDVPSVNFCIKLYYRKLVTNQNFVTYVKEFVGNGTNSNEFLELKNNSNGMILFFYNEEKTFVTTSGVASVYITKHVIQNWGKDIGEKLKYKFDAIKSQSSRQLAGHIQTSITHYRQSRILLQSENIGKYVRNIDAEISNEALLNEFGLEINRKKCNISMNDGIKIKKNIDLLKTIKLIEKIDAVDNRNTSKADSILNKLKFLTQVKKSSANGKLINALTLGLIKKISTEVIEAESVDVLHKNFEKYNAAVSYKIIYTYNDRKLEAAFVERPTFNQLTAFYNHCNEICNNDLKVSDFLLNGFVYSYDDDNKVITKDAINNHLSCEHVHDNEKYFLLCGTWYTFNQSYIDAINSDLQLIVDNKDLKLGSGLPSWEDDEIEDNYNLKFIDYKKSMVMHKVLVDNIEFADVIRFTKESLVFYHMKKGFNASMRDLCSQIAISAITIRAAIDSNDLSLFDEWYVNLCNKGDQCAEDSYFERIYNQTKHIKASEFNKFFSPDKQIEFHAVIKCKYNSLNDILKSKSNIAKISIIDLAHTLKGLGINLIIHFV